MGYKKQVFRSLAMVTQLGISVMTPVFLCIFAGHYADTHFGTHIMLPFLLLGVLAGGRCGYRMARMTLLADEREEQKEREEKLKEKQKERERSPRDTDTSVTKPKMPSRVRAASGRVPQAESTLPGGQEPENRRSD